MSSPGSKETSSGAQDGSPQVINLNTLDVSQLNHLRQQVHQESTFYQEAILQLKEVQSKMQEALNSLASYPTSKKSLLVPVTGSMFVPGEVEDHDSVIVDIGTGYYVEKTVHEAKDYFNRKVKFLQVQIEHVQDVGREKTQLKNAIHELLESKLHTQMQQQQQLSGKK